MLPTIHEIFKSVARHCKPFLLKLGGKASVLIYLALFSFSSGTEPLAPTGGFFQTFYRDKINFFIFLDDELRDSVTFFDAIVFIRMVE